jgi:excisionase family DNA binding protein
MNTTNLSKAQLEIVQRMYVQSLQGNGRATLAGREWDGNTALAGLEMRGICQPLPMARESEFRHVTASELTPDGLAWANELWQGKPVSEFDIPNLPNYSVTTAAAAEMLGVSLRRVQALIKTGKLSASHFGRAWQVNVDSVWHYKSNRRNGRPAQSK